jgi:hypothetical protein
MSDASGNDGDWSERIDMSKNKTNVMEKRTDDIETYETGARRSAQDGRGRYDLIPEEALLEVARVFEDGANQFGENNWRKGMPVARLMNSAKRHLAQWNLGCHREPHLGKAVWNILVMMVMEQRAGNDYLSHQEKRDAAKAEIKAEVEADAARNEAKPPFPKFRAWLHDKTIRNIHPWPEPPPETKPKRRTQRERSGVYQFTFDDGRDILAKLRTEPDLDNASENVRTAAGKVLWMTRVGAYPEWVRESEAEFEAAVSRIKAAKPPADPLNGKCRECGGPRKLGALCPVCAARRENE